MATSISMETMKKKFFSALLSDALDSVGHMQQVLPAWIRPLDPSLVMIGRARTAVFMDVYEMPAVGTNPYELEIALIDSLKAEDVPVFSCGRTGRIAPWGALLSTASQVRGASGAVMDGFVRDVRAVQEMKFPVFHGGIAPLDSKGRGKVVAIDIPVECGGVRVCAGDLVFGDADGCVVVPRAIEEKVMEVAAAKLSGENSTLQALRDGRSLADVFAEFHTL